MKKSILVTGVAGSGKSSVCKELKRMGHAAYDIEDMDGMFKMIRKDTGEDFDDYHNADMEKVKNADWICDKNKLGQLIEKQGDNIAYYCGVASNNDEMAPLFDKIILLQASPDVLRRRLKSREGTLDMGNTKENREWIFSWKDWWENKVIDNGAAIIDADGTPREVAGKIVEASALDSS